MPAGRSGNCEASARRPALARAWGFTDQVTRVEKDPPVRSKLPHPALSPAVHVRCRVRRPRMVTGHACPCGRTRRLHRQLEVESGGAPDCDGCGGEGTCTRAVQRPAITRSVLPGPTFKGCGWRNRPAIQQRLLRGRPRTTDHEAPAPRPRGRRRAHLVEGSAAAQRPGWVRAGCRPLPFGNWNRCLGQALPPVPAEGCRFYLPRIGDMSRHHARVPCCGLASWCRLLRAPPGRRRHPPRRRRIRAGAARDRRRAADNRFVGAAAAAARAKACGRVQAVWWWVPDGGRRSCGVWKALGIPRPHGANGADRTVDIRDCPTDVGDLSLGCQCISRAWVLEPASAALRAVRDAPGGHEPPGEPWGRRPRASGPKSSEQALGVVWRPAQVPTPRADAAI